MLSISKGNDKLGPDIPNISLTPIITCNKGIACTKQCYALRPYRKWSNVKKAWDKNLLVYRTNPQVFFDCLDSFIGNKACPYFRYHVGGDIPDRYYFNAMISLARNHTATRFLAYTKQYDLVNTSRFALPDNFSLVLSAWVGVALPNPKNYPTAWYQNGQETRIPETAKLCVGSCHTCKYCWHMTKGMHVIFADH